MSASDDYFRLWIESLAAEGIERRALEDKEAADIEWVFRQRRRRDHAIRDMEVAKLLPFGTQAIRERFGGCRATVYNRARRGRTLSKSGDGI